MAVARYQQMCVQKFKKEMNENMNIKYDMYKIKY